MKPQDKIFVTLGSAAIVAVAGFGGYALFTGGGSTPTASSHASQVATGASSNVPTAQPPTAAAASTATTATTYADGTYTADVRYYVPDEGQNSLKASVTISNGTISAVKSDDTYQDRKSRQYVDSFERGISSVAVGQPVANFSVGRVGGASLTSSAFNDALDTIRNEAKA